VRRRERGRQGALGAIMSARRLETPWCNRGAAVSQVPAVEVEGSSFPPMGIVGFLIPAVQP